MANDEQGRIQFSLFDDTEEAQPEPKPKQQPKKQSPKQPAKDSEPKIVKLSPREKNRQRARNHLLIEMSYLLGEERKLEGFLGRDDLSGSLTTGQRIAYEQDLANIRKFAKSLMLSPACYVCPHGKGNKCAQRYDYRNKNARTDLILSIIDATGLDDWRRELEKDLKNEECRKCAEIRDAVHARIRAKANKKRGQR